MHNACEKWRKKRAGSTDLGSQASQALRCPFNIPKTRQCGLLLPRAWIEPREETSHMFLAQLTATVSAAVAHIFPTALDDQH